MNPKDIAQSIIAELDHFQQHFQPQGGALTLPGQFQLKNEPFVAYAHVTNEVNADSTLLICRHYVPFDYTPADPLTSFASYFSPLGRIITKRPEEAHQFEVRSRRGDVLESHEYKLHEKCEFRPDKQAGRWDAVDNQIVWKDGRILVRSLRGLLEDVEEGPEIRKRRYSVQLPDQAILDQTQDEIFRLPFNARVRISGAPGTGKTTVLLKRLSQKTKRAFLTDEEVNAIRDEDWNDGRNWMLFTPSDLLKVYLKEAMAKELLPATDEHVKVYRTFRLEVLRDIGFIRVGQHGLFRAAAPGIQLIKRTSGTEQSALAKAFGESLKIQYADLFREAVQKFNNETRVALGRLTDANQRVLVKALDLLTGAGNDIIELRRAQERAAEHRRLNGDLTQLVQRIREVGSLQDGAGNASLSTIYRHAARLPDLIATVTTTNIDVAMFPEIPPIVATLRRELRGLNEAISLVRLFHTIARAYQEFRAAAEIQARFFLDGSAQGISDRLLSEAEQDVLLYFALDFVRTLFFELPNDQAGVPGEVRGLLSRFRLLVAVDEAADFSALEIACMELFATPRSGGVTISGDLMQRVTEQGLKDWAEMDALCARYGGYDLQVSYRQTERLFAIAKDLFAHATGTVPNFRSAFSTRPQDPPPLAFKSSSEHSCERWLTDRICEIYSLCNRHLPTTAILVPQDADVDALKALLAPLLMENGIEVEAARNGQSLGDSARVRIFPVEFIKGLEFEAVFYVGLDRMAEIHKELIDKFVYVGLSRARSLLGVTFERQWPARLRCIEQHFELQKNWADDVEP